GKHLPSRGAGLSQGPTDLAFTGAPSFAVSGATAGYASSSPAPAFVLYCRDKSRGHFHCGAFKSRLNFRSGFFVTLGLVVFEHTANSSLIPSARIFFGSHLFLLRLPRISSPSDPVRMRGRF